MIEYIIISAFYLIGVWYNALKQVGKLKKDYPQFSFNQIWATYFKAEWNVLMVSGVGLFTVLLLWFVIHRNNIPMPDWLHHYGGVYLIVMVLGYSIDRVVYKYLGSAETALGKKADDIAKLN